MKKSNPADNIPLKLRKPKFKIPKFYGSISVLNRWTQKPHEHKREVARRTRQAAQL